MHWRITGEEINLLPNGNHVGNLLEFLYQPAVMANTDTGGFSRIENTQIAMLGESYKWQRWFLGNADISHPSRPGEPLLYLPLASLSTVEMKKYGTLANERNGIHLSARDAATTPSFAQASLPLQIGGVHLIPRATADREPASDWGAPATSRGFAVGSAEAHSLVRLPTVKSAYLFADAFYARRHFNALPRSENGAEATLMASLNPAWLTGDRFHFALQARGRENLYAEFFSPQEQTMQSGQLSALAQYDFAAPHTQGAIALGYSYRSLSARTAALTRSATDSLIQPPPLFPEKTHTLFTDVSALKRAEHRLAHLEYGVNARAELEFRHTAPAAGRLTETLYTVPYAVTLYDGATREVNALLRWQPFLRAQRKGTRHEYGASTNAHLDWGFTDAGTKLGFIHPAARLWGKSYVASSAFFVGGSLLHDTLGFTLQEVSFLNRDSLSGMRYNFSDSNGNGIPDTGELGQAMRTGGKYHSAAKNLQAPQKEELNLDFGYDGWKNWRLALNLNGRIYRQLFEVRYAEQNSPQFIQNNTAGGITTFDKTSSGNESYVLRNAQNDAYYMHAEISLVKIKDDHSWIFHGSIGGYFAVGYTPHGLNMFYNDLGAYNESTADPNFRENRFARLDSERGYIGKIVFGRRFAKVLSVMNVLRYRDGEPVAGYRVVTGLAQGVQVLPFEERGGGLVGVGRHTYSLAWDLRLRCDILLAGKPAWAFVDIYNLLNSRTELSEYPIEGTRFRDPVEQGIARTLRLGFGMQF